MAVLAAGNPGAARAHAERGLAHCPPARGVETRAHLLAVLALSVAVLGAADRADALAQTWLDAVRGTHFGSVQAMGLTWVAGAAALSGTLGAGRKPAPGVARPARRHGTGRWVADALEYTVLVLAATARPRAAAEVLRVAEGLRLRRGEPIGGVIPEVAAVLEACRHRLPTLERDRSAGAPDLSTAADAALLLATRALDSEPDGGTI